MAKRIKKAEDSLPFPNTNVSASGTVTGAEAVNENSIFYNEKKAIATPKKATTRVGKRDVVINKNTARETELPGNLNDFLQNEFFLEIHVQNLVSIFTSGIIAPVKYVKHRAYPDKQTSVSNELFLTDKVYQTLVETSALLSINLFEPEVSLLKKTNNGFYLPGAIPVSRIARVHFANSEIAQSIRGQLRTEDAGFIPEWMISVGFPETTLSQEEAETREPLQIADVTGWSGQLQKFDQILGAFAYLKNLGILTADQNSSLITLPVHFLYMAQAITNLHEFAIVEKESTVRFYKQLFGLESPDPRMAWLLNRLKERRSFTKEDNLQFGTNKGPLVGEKIEPQVLEDILKKLNDPTKLKDTLKQIAGMNTGTGFYLYLFAFLRMFGNLSSEDVTTARKGAFPLLPAGDYAEIIVAFLGYFYGYQAMRNYDDKPTFKDAGFQQIAGGKRMPLKFTLESLLDSVIIECAYQVAFHGNAHFSSIDKLPAFKVQSRHFIPPNIPSGYSLTDSSILLGTEIFTVNKKAKTIALPDRVPFLSELGLYCWRKNLHRIVDINLLLKGLQNLPFVVCYTRETILEAIEAGELDEQEVEKRLAISRQLDAVK